MRLLMARQHLLQQILDISRERTIIVQMLQVEPGYLDQLEQLRVALKHISCIKVEPSRECQPLAMDASTRVHDSFVCMSDVVGCLNPTDCRVPATLLLLLHQLLCSFQGIMYEMPAHSMVYLLALKPTRSGVRGTCKQFVGSSVTATVHVVFHLKLGTECSTVDT